MREHLANLGWRLFVAVYVALFVGSFVAPIARVVQAADAVWFETQATKP